MSRVLERSAEAPFRNIDELNEAHDALLDRFRATEETRAMSNEAITFMLRAEQTGRVLYHENERSAAQSVLNYWSAALYRANIEPPSGDLVEFDPDSGEELADDAFPYSGLGAVPERDLGELGGWQRLLRESFTALRRHHLVALIGGSGSGRTSLLLRGLLPRLRAEGLAEAGALNCPNPIQPGSEPVEALAALVAGQGAIRATAERIRKDPAWVAELRAMHQPTLVSIDDFEDIFLADQEECDAFVAALAALVDGGHYVVLVLQSEYVGRLARYPQLSRIVNEGAVTMAFDTSELRQLIEAPARRIGLFFESGVVDRLLRSVQGDPAALALLQFNLWRLWQHRRRNWITLEVYQQVGGGRLALERAAEEAYAQLTSEQQQLAQQIFLRPIHPRLAGFVTRPVRVGDYSAAGLNPEATAAVIECFVRAGLLKRLAEGDIITLTHEAVVTNWLRLTEWLESKRAEQRNRLLLRSTARKWQTQKKDPSLLWRRGQVNDARTFDELSRLEREFLSASSQNYRFKYILTIAGIVAILLLGVLAVVQYIARQRAEAAASAARAAQATLALASTSAEKGTRLFDEGDAIASALWLADALKRTESALPDIERRRVERSPRERELLDVRSQRLAMALRQVPILSAQVWHPDSSAFALSPDGQSAITASEADVRLWNLNDESSGQTIATNGASSVAFSPDGRFFATAQSDKSPFGIQIWNAKDHSKVANGLFETRAPPSGIYFSPGEEQTRYVAVVTDARAEIKPAAQIWALDDPKQTWKHEEEVKINHLAFSPDGECVSLSLGTPGSNSGLARIWRFLQRPGLTRSLPHAEPVLFSDFSPNDNGARLVTASGDREDLPGAAQVWDVNSGHPITGQLTHRRGMCVARFNPTGARIVSAGLDNAARVWDVATSRLLLTLPHEGWVLDARFSPDARLLLTGSRDRRARVWDLATGRLLLPPLHHPGSVTRAEFSADGRRVIARAGSGIRRWELESRVPPAPLLETTKSVREIALSADRRRVITATQGDKSDVRIWEIAGGKEVTGSSELDASRAKSQGVTAVALSRDGARAFAAISLRLPAGGTEKNVSDLRVWEIPSKTGKSQTNSLEVDGEVVFASFGNRNADRLVVITHEGDLGGSVYLVNVPQGNYQRLETAGAVRFASFDLDDERLVTCGTAADGRTGIAQVWRAYDGEPLAKSLDHKEMVRHASFGPNNRLVTASADNSAKVWDIISGKCLKHLDKLHSADLTSCVFSRDGKRILTTSFDGTAVVCDWETGTHVSFPHGGGVDMGAFDAEGHHFVTTCADRAARIWDVPTGELIAVLPHRGDLQFASFTESGCEVVTLSLSDAGSGTASASTAADTASTKSPAFLRGALAEARVWKCVPKPTVDDWQSMIEAIATEHVDNDGKLTRLTGDQTAEQWKSVHGGQDAVPSGNALDWHRREAAICERGSRWFGAAWHLERALKLQTHDPALHMRAANAWFRSRNWAAAEQHCSAILQRDPADLKTLEKLKSLEKRADARIELGVEDPSRLSEAEADCWEMVALWNSESPGDPFKKLAQIYTDRAYAETDAGNGDRAAELRTAAIWALERARSLQPGGSPDSKVFQRLASLQLYAGDREAYLQTCRDAVNAAVNRRYSDEFDDSRATWACVLAPDATDQYEVLKGKMSELIERYPDRFWIRTTFGALLYRQGNYSAAVDALKDAIRTYASYRNWQMNQADEISAPPAAEVSWEGRPQDWIFLAMAYARLQSAPGASVEDRRRNAGLALLYLSQAQEAIRRGIVRYLPFRTWNRLDLDLLLHEAEALIGVQAVRMQKFTLSRPLNGFLE